MTIAFAWRGQDGQQAIVAVNYAPNQSQCYLPLSLLNAGGDIYELKSLMGSEIYERSGDSLVSPGLYLDLPDWGYEVFKLMRKG